MKNELLAATTSISLMNSINWLRLCGPQSGLINFRNGIFTNGSSGISGIVLFFFYIFSLHNRDSFGQSSVLIIDKICNQPEAPNMRNELAQLSFWSFFECVILFLYVIRIQRLIKTKTVL